MDINDFQNYISPPGDTIWETMEFFGLDKGRLAYLLGGVGVPFIERLILGDIEIDEKLAIQLEDIFSIPREFWIERERLYRNKLKQLGDIK